MVRRQNLWSVPLLPESPGKGLDAGKESDASWLSLPFKSLLPGSLPHWCVDGRPAAVVFLLPKLLLKIQHLHLAVISLEQ